MNLKLMVKKISAILIAAAITFGVLPSILGNNVVLADGEFDILLNVATYDKDGNEVTPKDAGGTVKVTVGTEENATKVKKGDTITLDVTLNTGYVLNYACFGNGAAGYQSGKTLTFTVPDDYAPMIESNQLVIDVVFYEDYTYPLWVGGVQVTTSNMYDIAGVTGGKASYSPADNILTLDKVTGFSGYHGGDVAIFQDYSTDKTLSVFLSGDTVISDLNSNQKFIYSKNSDVVITGYGTLTVNGTKPDMVVCAAGNIYVSAVMNTTSGRSCLKSDKDIYIYTSITATSTGEANTFKAEGTIHIWGGTFKANANPTTPYSFPIAAGGIDIKDTHEITGVSFDDPDTLSNDSCGISEYSSYYYIYSNNAGDRVRGVIIEQTTFNIDTRIYTYDVDGNLFDSDAGGSVTLNKTSGAKGDNITVTATPNEGYELYVIQWVNGTDYYNITDSKEHVIEDHDVILMVYFKALPPVTTYSVGVNVSTLDKDGNPITEVGGTASVDKTSGITGDKVTVTATPNEGYEVYMIAWGNGGASTDITTSKEFTIKDFDVKVEVIFKEVASSSGSTSGTPATTTYSVGVTVSTWDKDGNAVTAVGGTASVDKTSGTTGDKVTVTATPNEGYEVYMVTWGDGGVSADITTSKEFTIEDFDVTVDVIFKEVSTSTSSSGTTTDPSTSTSGGSTATMDPSAPTYTVIQGADSTVDGTKDLVVEVQRSVDDEHCLSYFDWVAIDGVKLTEEQAPTSSGSTIVTIKAEYLKTLSEGKHTIVVNFVDNSVSTTFTLQSAAQKSGANIPSTGELQSPAMYIGIALIAAACGVTGIVVAKKRKEEA